MKKLFLLLLISINVSILSAQKNANNYIEMLDGKIINLDGKKINDDLFFTNKLKANGEKYPVNEVKGYQNNGVYYKQYNKKFYERRAHGKINFYFRLTETSTTTTGRKKYRIERYIQKGDNGKMVKYSTNALRTMVKDNKAALAQLNKFQRSNKISSLIIYPGTVLLCVGGYLLVDNLFLKEKEDRNSTLTTVGAATTAVGVGVYGYGFYKKIKAAENLKKIFDIYNME